MNKRISCFEVGCFAKCSVGWLYPLNTVCIYILRGIKHTTFDISQLASFGIFAKSLVQNLRSSRREERTLKRTRKRKFTEEIIPGVIMAAIKSSLKVWHPSALAPFFAVELWVHCKGRISHWFPRDTPECFQQIACSRGMKLVNKIRKVSK